MHPSLEHVDHRPWPLPGQPWKWRQSWLDLAFLHYRVDSEKIRALLPPGVQLQEYDGTAWVGLVPFRMAGVMCRGLPDVPKFSAFPELNLRTYVEVGGKPGVWFFSLDADSWAIVFGGRRFYDLPYFSARMEHAFSDGWHSISSVRRVGEARFSARYRPVSEVFYAEQGTFEHWASERYCLYSYSARNGIARVEVHHVPWPLQRAEVMMDESNMLSAAGIDAIESDPVCHFSTIRARSHDTACPRSP